MLHLIRELLLIRKERGNDALIILFHQILRLRQMIEGIRRLRFQKLQPLVLVPVAKKITHRQRKAYRNTDHIAVRDKPFLYVK